MQRYLSLGFAAVCVFVVVAFVLLKVMPAPLREFDYMVVGSVATLVALLVMFLVMIATSRSSNVFFRKRRK